MPNLSGYFDYAASTPLDKSVLESMQPYFTEGFYNPSAIYGPSREIKQALNVARSDVASIIGAKPVEIIFTAGCTEANNIAIYGIMENYPKGNIIVSAVEHDSVLQTAKRYNYKICPVSVGGMIDISNLQKLIDEDTVMVSIMIANNEIGTIQPLRKISQIIDSIRNDRRRNGIKTPLYLHTDAAQGPNYLDLHVNRMGVDMMSLNGGKIYGPKQSGALYVKSGIVLKPMIIGGGQERGIRSGTENIPAIIGFTESLKMATNMRQSESARLTKLQKSFFDALKVKIPNAQINGTLKSRLPNNVHISIPGQDNERLLIILDENGIYAAAGSACSASQDEPSHVLSAIGLDDEQMRSSIRFSMGRQTNLSSVQRAVDSLSAVLA